VIRTVAFVGLGTMGRPMALNVLKGGFALRAYDIAPDAVAALAEAGAAGASSSTPSRASS
jgi:3-hydroxyisobutyrate dehydrogenase